MRVIKNMPDQNVIQIIQVVEIIAAPLISGLVTWYTIWSQRRKEAATAKKIMSEGVNVDADTDSKYGQNYLRWTQEFRDQLQKTNEKLTQTQTDLMKVTTELYEIRAAKITLEVNYKDLQIKFETIQKQKLEQDVVIENQRIEIQSQSVEIARLTDEVRMLKESKSKRGKNAGNSIQSS